MFGYCSEQTCSICPNNTRPKVGDRLHDHSRTKLCVSGPELLEKEKESEISF